MKLNAAVEGAWMANIFNNRSAFALISLLLKLFPVLLEEGENHMPVQANPDGNKFQPLILPIGMKKLAAWLVATLLGICSLNHPG